MLQINDAHAYYGHIHALKGVTLAIPKGKIVSLLGSNGAGKSTTLKMISKLVELKQGTMHFENQSIKKNNPSQIVKKGIIHCLEARGVFPEFTVEENLQIGAYTRKDANIKKDMDMVYNYFPRLKERSNQVGETLSGGEEQMLAIGRALMSKPKLLLLDEPSLGIAPLLVIEIFDMLKKINEEGMTILLVEQNVNLALSISHYGYVLENGNIALEGEAEELQKDSSVRKFYLGG